MISKVYKVAFIFLIVAAIGILSSCNRSASTASEVKTVKLDYAYYNPVSLVLKEKKWLEDELQKDGIEVEWVFSAGSNKALELLNSKSIDFGSTAGSAALLGKANGNPIKSIYVYSKPEWTALVVRAGSPIEKVKDLKRKKIAVTRGTDPYIFLLRALDTAGLSEKDVEIVQLQHPDGKTALEKGDVDAWAGLDPYIAQTEIEKHSKLFFRNADWNTYGFLNVREAFAKDHPEIVEKVLKAYEKARKWAIENPDEFVKIVAAESKQSEEVTDKVLSRTDLTNPVIGEVHKQTIEAAGEILLKSGVIDKSVDIKKTIDDLIDPQYIKHIDKN
ncbi:aliphatic sulfonate ABC transporter substrate-binding protein [Thermaerobacillus caldiproteolyticus]|uniref:aliphatic sulfonate ABC transporter substrate-binding protein n=1 Tax=Thermaerobacillus caldiproteolyticus TaxID=247480 RepID=UPI00188C1983|nr:aliphatic sulfonate ABC transporter substrate-binding protein [Anoxybacillus caldiproteolyticus]QPA31165.1 aliphatic sulfonate ABC transporter substrate-binding protein [Anoxybacillus caldiproteolyticus]